MKVDNENLADNFDFALIGVDTKFPFRGYISSLDRTSAGAGVLIKGSQNVYKKLSGAMAVRPGLKRRGAADTTSAGVKSSYEWNNSSNQVRPLRVANGKLQVESDAVTPGTFVWYDLLTGLTNTRYVFDAWWDDTAKHDLLLMVDGTPNLRAWQGGVGKIASSTSTTITLAGTTSALQLGFSSSGGFVTINGNTYQFTGVQSVPNTIYTKTDDIATILFDIPGPYISQLFTTSASATAILSATAHITNDGAHGAHTLSAEIWTDNGGVPGNKIGQTSLGAYPANTSTVDVPFTFNINVTPLTNYHLVVYNGETNIDSAHIGNTGSVGTHKSIDNGVTWTNINGYLYATVVENDASPELITGVTPNPTGEAIGSVVLSKVINKGQILSDGAFNIDFLKIINNQVHLGSYVSRLAYISSDSDYTNYTIPTTRVSGNPDLLTLDSALNGIGVLKGTGALSTAIISGGTGDWYTIQRSNITVGSTLVEQVDVVKTQSADGQAALAHEFIDGIGDSLIFLDQRNQLRQFGTVRNIVTPVYPLLSLDVQDELQEQDFTGGHLRSVGEIIYITQPLLGIMWMYEMRQKIDDVGNLTAERLWQTPFVNGAARVAVINGVEYIHSNANPQIYQIWNTNQWHDDSPTNDNLPYTCIMRHAYMRGGARTTLTKFSRTFYEGYLDPGSEVNGVMYYEYLGALDKKEVVINSTTKPAKTYLGTGGFSLGDETLGDEPLGDSVDTETSPNLPKFRRICDTAIEQCFEYALEINSDALDANWEILTFGTNQIVSNTNPVQLNK